MKNLKKLYLLPVLFILFLLPLSTFALSIQNEDSVYIGTEQIIEDDLIATGSRIIVEGYVKGDVIAAGQDVTIKGIVEGDVIAAGMYVKVESQVLGDVRVAGSDVRIGGNINKNLNAFGATVTILDSAKVMGNALIAGGGTDVNGLIMGKLTTYAGTSSLNATVEKDAYIEIDPQSRLVLMPKTNIKGNLTYKSTKELNKQEGATVLGETTQEMPKVLTDQGKKSKAWPGILVAKLVSLIGMFIVGLVLIGLFRDKLYKITDIIWKSPWQSLLWGIIFLIVVPILAIILLITVIGIPLSIVGILVYVTLLYVSGIFTALVIGQSVVNLIGKKQPAKKGNQILFLVVGLVIIGIICLIPFVGFFIRLLTILFGTGALVKAVAKV